MKLSSADIVQRLSKSQIYRDYEAAFNQATHLPLAIRAPEIWGHAMQGKKHENPFCALMGKANRSCAACLQVQQELREGEPGEPHSVVCFAGLTDTSIPLQAGNQIVGFLQTGQVAHRKPTQAGFSKVSQQLVKWGIQVDLKELEESYFHGRVISREQYQAMISLLNIFAQHLSMLANQIMIEQQNEESPMIKRAKQYIGEHQAEALSLEEMAKKLNVSTFYFCKMFKKATGLTFTDYLSRTRIERAKNLLLNPNVRISEVAYECGFVSLTHFNRIFKKVVGKSPTTYRHSLPS